MFDILDVGRYDIDDIQQAGGQKYPRDSKKSESWLQIHPGIEYVIHRVCPRNKDGGIMESDHGRR